MAPEPGPGSVISIGSSSGDDQSSSGNKRRREDDSDDDTSSSGSSRSESPGSRVDAVGMTRKGAKRQKGMQKSVEAGGASSSEEGEMSDDTPSQPVTRRVTRSQSRRLESPEKGPNPGANGEAKTAAKKKKKNKQVKADRYHLPELLEPGPSRTLEDVVETWYSAFLDRNKDLGFTLKPDVLRNKFIDQIPINWKLGNKGRVPLRRAIKSMNKSGRLHTILKEAQDKWAIDGVNQKSQPPRQPVSSEMVMSISSDSEEEYEPTLGTAILDTGKGPQKPGPAVNGASNTMANGRNSIDDKIPLGDEALFQQRRYFPSASDPSSMCLLCGRSGHTATGCPHLACRFCNSTEHADFLCPSRARCDKCRQLGHTSKACAEKLALTKDEGLACSFCSANDHLEKECTELWRSFHPEQEKLHTVTFIPPTCSSCGVEGEHYSGDCQNIKVQEVNPTWTLRNHDRYVDAQATEQSIEKAAAAALGDAAPRTRGPEMKIRGHSKTQHVQFHDSDSDTEFLGQPATKGRAPIGQIRMSSNIQMPSDTRTGNTRGRGPPPLPPGPPPPGPPPPRQDGRDWQLPFAPPPPGAPRYDSRPQGPPPSLPARPPPQKQYHHVPPPASHQQNTGGQSGGKRKGKRGGDGGGGRGRGRGRGRR